MITGDKIILTLFENEDDVSRYWKLYMNLNERSPFDHTELYSKSRMMAEFRESGMWSSSRGTMLIRATTSEIVGTVSFKSKSNVEAIVGYRIFETARRNQGMATEALQLFSSYLFNTTAIERITLEISAANAPSIRLAEKCGFVREGTKRSSYYCRGTVSDMHIYGILRSECMDS